MEDIIRDEVNAIKMIKELNTLNLDDRIMVLEKALEGDDRWLQWKEDHESYRYSDRILSEVGKAVVEDDVAYKVSQLIYEGSPDRHTEPSLALDISIDTILEIKEPEEYDELLRQIRYMVIYDPLLRADGYLDKLISSPLIYEKIIQNIDVLDLDKVGINVDINADNLYLHRFLYNINRLNKRLETLGIPGYLANVLVYSSVKDPEIAPAIISIMKGGEFTSQFDELLDQIQESHFTKDTPIGIEYDSHLLKRIGNFIIGDNTIEDAPLLKHLITLILLKNSYPNN